MNSLLKVFFISFIVSLLFGCNDGDPSEAKDNFDRGPILVNLAENLILPAYQDFSNKTEILASSVERLTDSLSQENLTSAKAAWLSAKVSWNYAQVFNFGPVDSRLLSTAIDFWPTSAVGIENEIGDFDGPENFLDRVGDNKKGLTAVEYILFHEDSATILLELEDENRRGYLLELTKDIYANASVLLNDWKVGYKSSFINNTGNDVGSSATAVANEMVYLVEIIKNFKVGIPAGISTGGTLYPEKVESYYAGESVSMILKNLEAVEDVFTGKVGQGFDDYLNALGLDSGSETLVDKIIAQIGACRATVDTIDGSLQNAVEIQSATMEQLFIDLQALTVLMKTDMMSRLGLIVTYSDNDGD